MNIPTLAVQQHVFCIFLPSLLSQYKKFQREHVDDSSDTTFSPPPLIALAFLLDDITETHFEAANSAVIFMTRKCKAEERLGLQWIDAFVTNP